MPPALTLRAALTRGAVVALANWPVVVVDFLVESLYKATLAVPVIGGALMVSLLVGADMRTILGEGFYTAAQQLLEPLSAAPGALGAFLVALVVAGVGGAVLMYIVKGGTLAVLSASDALTPDIAHRYFEFRQVRETRMYSYGLLWTLTRAFQRRSAILGFWLGVAYTVIGSAYLLALGWGFQYAASVEWSPALGLLVLLSTSAALIAITVVNLVFDLARVIIVTDDCSVTDALGRVRWFLLTDARHVIGIFGVMGGIVLFGIAASLAVTAGLTLLSWVPILGVLFVPLQIAFWIARSLVFQYLNLATLCAYITQYRRLSAPRTATTIPFQARPTS